MANYNFDDRDSMNWLKLKAKRLKLAAEERGYILGLVMIFFVVFTIMGLTFIKMASFESIHAVGHYLKLKAFYYAEEGIYKGLWRVNNLSGLAGTYSDANVSVTYDSVALVMRAVGTAGDAQDSIKVTLEGTSAWQIATWEEP